MVLERNVAFHEAAHAVVAWYFGWTPTFITLAAEDVRHGETHNDRTGFADTLPGSGLIRTLVGSCVQVIQHASGGCAELALGTEYEDCGWSGDFAKFEPVINAVSKVCGYSYDHCWALLSAMTKEILAEPSVWSLVEELAARLLSERSMSEEDLRQFFDGRSGDGLQDRVQTLLRFVDTPHARAAARGHEMSTGQDV